MKSIRKPQNATMHVVLGTPRFAHVGTSAAQAAQAPTMFVGAAQVAACPL